MTEEPVTNADAHVGTFDQSGDIGDDEFAAIDPRDAKIGMKGGKGIIRDLRLGSGYSCKEGRLPRIGKTDKTGIGDQLQTKPDRAFIALKARIGAARRAIGRRLEMLVAEAAIATLGKPEALPDLIHVADQRLVVFFEYLRAGRHLQHDIGTVGTGAVAPHAMPASLGLEVLLVTIVDQRVQAIDGFHPHVTTTSAIAAVRAAELEKLLTPEGNRTGSTVARANIDFCLIEKFHLFGGSFSCGASCSASLRIARGLSIILC